MDLKLGLKIGHIELQFEGSSSVFESKIEPAFKELLKYGQRDIPLALVSELPAINSRVKAEKVVPAMTVKSIAAKLGGDSGGDLLYASIASLAVVKQKESFTRKEANDEIKLATGYYKPTYSSGNLSGYLDALCKKGVLIESSKDTYTLKESARSEMEQKLAQ